MLRRSTVRASLRAFAAVTATAAAAGASVLVAVPPASAVVTGDTYVTAIGGGDRVGGTAAQLFHPGNATVKVSGTASTLDVELLGGTHGRDLRLILRAPEGETLVPGTYESGVSAFGLENCVPAETRMVVADMATGDDGVVNRFLATYEHRCDGEPGTLVGQIAIDQPAVSDVLVAATRADWGDAYRGVAARTVPVWLVNRGDAAVTVGAPSIVGDHAADFAVAADTCDELAAGATCAMNVVFTPGAAGPRAATLSFGHSTDVTRVVPLSGSGIPGHSAIHLHSDAGDPVGGGGAFHYVPPADKVLAKGTASSVEMTAPGWAFVFAPASGSLTPGVTYSTTLGATMTVIRTAAGCSTSAFPGGPHSYGSFTVTEATFDPVTGEVETFSATFQQRCRTTSVSLRGWLSWRAAEPNDPPAASALPVTGLRPWVGLDSVDLTWTNPPGSFSYVVVRGAVGNVPPASPTAGFAVYTGPGSSTGLRGLSPSASYSFSVWARDVVGTTSPARSTTVRGTALVLSTPPPVTYGQPVYVKAKVVEVATNRGVSNARVELFFRKKGALAWSYFGYGTTDSYGVANVYTLPGATYEWQAVFYGQNLHLGSFAGPVTASVAHRVSATLSATTIRRNYAVTVKGAVAPSRAGQYVYLQRYYNGAWRNAATIRLTSTSAYSYVFRPSAPGTWKYRVYKPGDASLAAGVSPTRTLSVT